MTVGKKKRFEIFKRDEFTCQYCGRQPPSVILEVDHVIPVSDGGSDHATNLVASCFDCNRGKRDGSLNVVLQKTTDLIARQRELQAQSKAFNQMLMDELNDRENTIKRIGHYWFNQFLHRQNAYVFGTGRSPSISTFLAHLVEAEIIAAINIAFARKPVSREKDDATWKYFCGVCWTKIRSKEESK